MSNASLKIPKDYRELVVDLENNGFTFVRRTNHAFLYRDKFNVTIGIPTSPGDWRGLRNTRAELRRALAQREVLIQEKYIDPLIDRLTRERIPNRMAPTVILDMIERELELEAEKTKPPLALPAPTFIHVPEEEPVVYIQEDERECSKCHTVHPLERFNPNKDGSRQWTCKNCVTDKRLLTLHHKREAKKEAPVMADIYKGPVTVPTATQPSFGSAVFTAPTPPVDALSPEAMALRILKSRHKAEYDQLLIDQMAALGYDE